jgi:hypothetical protein
MFSTSPVFVKSQTMLSLSFLLFTFCQAPAAPSAPRQDATIPADTPAVSNDKIPAGISRSDWNDIRSAYEEKRHATRATGRGFEARTWSQSWMAQFDGRGFTTIPNAGGWTWGLELAGLDLAPIAGESKNTIGRAPAVSAKGNRVSYEWNTNITEWYVNDQRGLEHGYTIQSRPASARYAPGSDPNNGVAIALRVRGALQPRISPDKRSVRFVNDKETTVVNYSGLTVLDSTGSTIPSHFELGANNLVIRVDDHNATYPLTIDPVAHQAYIKASNPQAFDEFGEAVAVSNDTIVVGARLEDSNATGVDGDQLNNSLSDSGAAYVFQRINGVWSQQAYLKASNTDAEDRFGAAVAISGDTIVVGAYLESSNSNGVNFGQGNNSANSAGAAYVFVRNGTTWTQQAYLKCLNTEANDLFGWSVAISGDTVVVGAYLEDSSANTVNGNMFDNSASAAGAAYVFVRNGVTWSQQAYLKASNSEALDTFGWDVDISGDTIVVSAEQEDSGSSGVNGEQTNNNAGQAGSAYVFVRNGTTWTQQAYLKPSNNTSFDFFGHSVAISGNTIVVGAPFEDGNATGVNGPQTDLLFESGAAYVFVRNGTAWSQQAYLKASTTTGGMDNFGDQVAISGNIIAVGMQLEDSNATGIDGDPSNSNSPQSGAVFVFKRTGTTWAQQAYVKPLVIDSEDRFGRALAISGDLLAVAAPREDSNATGVDGDFFNNLASSAGAVWLFDLDNKPGIVTYGTGTPGCAGTQTLGTTHTPFINSPHFGITTDNAPPLSLGLCLMTDSQNVSGANPFGIGVLVHVDVFAATEILNFDFVSDINGFGVTLNSPIPNNLVLVGKTYYAMGLWVETQCALPPFNLSSSQGIAITIQAP